MDVYNFGDLTHGIIVDYFEEKGYDLMNSEHFFLASKDIINGMEYGKMQKIEYYRMINYCCYLGIARDLKNNYGYNNYFCKTLSRYYLHTNSLFLSVCYIDLGLSYNKKDINEFNEFIDLKKKIVANNTKYEEDYDLYMYFGNIYYLRGLFSLALLNYQNAYRIDNLTNTVYRCIGNTLIKLDNYILAELFLKSSLDINDDIAENWNYYGQSLYYQGKIDESINAFNKSINLDNNYLEPKNFLQLINKNKIFGT